MKRTFLTLLLLVLFVAPALAAGDSTIGRIKTLTGSVEILREGSTLSASLGAPLQQGDTLTSSTDSSVGMTFKDNTVMSMGPESKMTLDEFVFDPTGGKMSFGSSIFAGTMTYLSGEIGKLSPQTVHVNTPVATIGIRGTHFAVKVAKR